MLIWIGVREGLLSGCLGKGGVPVEAAAEDTRQSVEGRREEDYAVALLFAAEHAMTKLNPVIDAWADVVRACYGGTHCQRGVDG